MTTTDDVISLNAAETAKQIRKALREECPGAKISVTISRGTGYGYMHASWTDGPTTKQVDAVTNRYRSASFDGMTDSTNHFPPQPTVIDGEPRMVDYTCYGVLPQRRYSPEATAWAMEVGAAGRGKFERDHDYLDGDVNHAMVHRILQQVDLTTGFPDVAASARDLAAYGC